MLFLYFILVPFIHGFLLDNQQSGNGQTIANGQFLTASEFYEEIKLRDQATERLRQDTSLWQHQINKNLALLSSQLQQKFHTLEQTLSADQMLNETKHDLELLEKRYHLLEENYKKLQQENNVLQKNYVLVVNDLLTVKNKTQRVEESGIAQERVNNATFLHLRVQDEELNTIKNKSLQVEKDMYALKQLSNIKPLQEIGSLQQTVNILSTKTNSLSMNEQARRQDFLALFNITVDTKRSLANLDTLVSRRINELEQNQTEANTDMKQHFETLFQRIQISQNNTVMEFENAIQEAERSANDTYSMMKRQIDANAEEVAMTSFVSSDLNLQTGSVVQFSQVFFSVGISDLTLYRNSGKFKCEKHGLYTISVTITMYDNGGEFYIYVNGKKNYYVV
ncbi:interaptin-like [Mytilus edulis]|uniref:interaptin-like n=1 Tax=Mytilus edulis TaxID=6550 RepID=UPI0039F0076F